MATYILRAFNVDLASTGFKCVMLSGSFAVGDRIDTEKETKDAQNVIVDINTVTVDSSKVSHFKTGGSTYKFGSTGMCITKGFFNYRLMLAGTDEDSSEVGSLNKLCDILEDINRTLAAYTERVDQRLSDLDDRVTALEKK